MEIDYPEHYAGDINEAIEIAKHLQNSGKFDIFRGQFLNFPIRPTGLREGIDRKKAAQDLNHFHEWVRRTPELASLHDAPDAVLAVAQHYGMPTPLLDFTTDPNIAGHFASLGKLTDDIPVSQRVGTIICANRQRLADSWRDINERAKSKEPYMDLVRVVELDVRNLWRLQAQRGLFLKIHVDPNLLEMFSHLLHIYFPQSNKQSTIEDRQVYPPNRSHLETLLDQYFLIRSYPERRQKMNEVFGHEMVIAEDRVRASQKKQFKTGDFPPIHPSWNMLAISGWLEEPDDQFLGEGNLKQVTIVVDLAQTAAETFGAVWKKLMLETDLVSLRSAQNVDWRIETIAGEEIYVDGEGSPTIEPVNSEFDDEENDSVAGIVAIIFDGMRLKPYSSNHISTAIAAYLGMLVESADGLLEDIADIEMIGGWTRGRCFCNSTDLLHAMRCDLLEYVKNDVHAQIEQQGWRGSLGLCVDPQRLFVFDEFINLFAEQLIPTQALLRVEKDVFVLNPARVEQIGES
ncbi:MAG: FRG domain-containing protein [Hyphomicrobiaceae bacterium]